MNPYLSRLNEISSVLKQRMNETDIMIVSATGGAEIDFATHEEKQELHFLLLKLQEIEAIHAAGAKERIAERIRNRRRSKNLEVQPK